MIFTYHMISRRTREVICVFEARTLEEAARTFAVLDGKCRFDLVEVWS